MFMLLACVGLVGSAFLLDFGGEEYSDSSDDEVRDETGLDVVDPDPDIIAPEPNVPNPDTPDVEDDSTIETWDPSPLDPINDPEEDAIDTAHIEGTASSDTLSGANVHIDEASGIVQLVDNGIAETIEGNDGDDCILLGGSDVGIGGAGEDEFVVDGDCDEEQVSLVKDFVPGEDILHISLPSKEEDLQETWPDRPEFTGDIELEHEEGFTNVYVDDVLVCKLEGTHELGPDDVKVLYDYHANVPTDFDITYGY